MKKLIFLLSILCIRINGYAQNEGNNWVFPDQCGIRFNGVSAVPFSSAIAPNVGLPLLNQTSISDTNGDMFCYAAATSWYWSSLHVFDRNNNVMPNGSTLAGHTNFASLLLPYPDRDSLICLFHLCLDSTNLNQDILFYSLIDKNANSGLGDVILRDSVLYNSSYPLSQHKLAACKHANGRDWWIFIADLNLGYVSFLLTPNGISFNNVQFVGSFSDSLELGKMIFSNDGTKMVSVCPAGILDVFDFDRCTGQLGNFRDVGEHLTPMPYQYFSVSFSPNGNLVYASAWNTVKVFYQWDLTAGNIQASKTLLCQYPDTGMITDYTYFWHNLGPDGKIYIPMANNYFAGGNNYITQHLDVIEFPDTPGIGCNYVRQGFDLGGRRVTGCLPNMPFYGLGSMNGSPCDSLVSDILEISATISKELSVFPNPFTSKFTWQLHNSEKIEQVFISDITRRNIKHLSPNLSDAELNLTPGVYILSVKTKTKTYNTKLVCQSK